MKEIHRISITDAVVEAIKKAIDSGEYQPGTKLPTEAAMCQEMKVSRSSVREAMRVLQALGYVTIAPGRGAFVAKEEPRTSDPWYEAEGVRYSDFMEIRLAIETLAVRLAVKRASAEEVQELAEIHESFCEANKTHDMAKLIMLDELFHTKIMECTGNPLFVNINKQIQECFRTYRGESFSNDAVYSNAVEPHARILQCFKDRDPEQAVLETQKHLAITQEDMIKVIHGV